MKSGEIFMPSFKVHSHCGNNSLILVYFSVTTSNRSTFTFCRCNLNKKHVFRCENVAVTKEIALAVTVNEPFGEKLCFYTCLWCCSQGVSVQGGICPERGLCQWDTPVRLKSGQNSSYWNAFLFIMQITRLLSEA